MIKKRKVLLLFICVLFICKGAFSGVDEKVLKGIDMLKIGIEYLSDEAKNIGLTRGRLRTVTELRLRKEGITIFGKEHISTTYWEIPRYRNTPIILVNVSVVGNAFRVSLEIFEYVILRRDESIECLAFTWNENMLGTHGNNVEYIVTALGELLDEFLNDYYKANPKK